MAIILKDLEEVKTTTDKTAPKFSLELLGVSYHPPLRYYPNSVKNEYPYLGSMPWFEKNKETGLIQHTPADCQWRDRLINNNTNKNRINVQWCYDTIAGYIVTVVKSCGLVGVSYCSPTDAIPRWNPEPGINLAYNRRRINANIKFGKNQKQRVVDFVAIDSMVNGFTPQRVLAEIRKNYSPLVVKI